MCVAEELSTSKLNSTGTAGVVADWCVTTVSIGYEHGSCGISAGPVLNFTHAGLQNWICVKDEKYAQTQRG